MMRVLVGVALLLTSAPVPAFAAEPTEDKVVCKRIDQADTGSHLGGRRKICKKSSEWRAEDAATQRAMREVRGRSELDPASIPKPR